MIGPNPLRLRFDKINGFIRTYDGIRYLVLFGPEKYDAIYNRVRYLISLKSSIKYVLLTITGKQSWFLWFFTYRKTLTFHNIIIIIKSVLNKDQNRYYYHIFLKKCSYQLTKK